MKMTFKKRLRARLKETGVGSVTQLMLIIKSKDIDLPGRTTFDRYLIKPQKMPLGMLIAICDQLGMDVCREVCLIERE